MSHWHKIVGLAALVAAGCNNGLQKTKADGGCSNCDVGSGATSGGDDGGTSEGTGGGTGGGNSNGGADAGTPCVQPDAGTVADPTYTRDWVVSPTGSDGADGTAASPFRTIARGIQAASPGERVLVMPGTYAERIVLGSGVRSGTSDKPIRLQGQGAPKIVPDGSGWSLVQMERSYWQIDGFDIDMQSQHYVGVGIANAQGDSVSNSHIHHGTFNGGITIYSNATGVRIEGNEIDHNWKTPVDDSHGIGIEWTAKDVTIRNNVIHENSGDSIQCEGPETYADAPPADKILIEGNEMYGDYEQAVDIKTCSNVRIANNWMHDYRQWPSGCSMVIHMSASNVTVEDNRFYNVGNAIAIGGNHFGPVPFNVVVRRNRIWSVHKGANGYQGVGIRLNNSEQAQVLNNTIWDTDFAAIEAGGCDQGDTSNMISRNNILAPSSGGYAYYFGTCMVGFASGPNLFAPGASISAASGGGRESLSLAAWQLSGQDASSRVVDPQLDPDTLAPGAGAVDWGKDIGQAYCGAAPDLGAVETACPVVPVCG